MHRLRFHHHGAFAYGSERTADAAIDVVNVSAADQSWGLWSLLPSDPCPGGDGRSFDLASVSGIQLAAQ